MGNARVSVAVRDGPAVLQLGIWGHDEKQPSQREHVYQLLPVAAGSGVGGFHSLVRVLFVFVVVGVTRHRSLQLSQKLHKSQHEGVGTASTSCYFV